MRKRIQLILLMSVLTLSFLFSDTAQAANTYNKETVFDYADLFTQEEEDAFRKYAEKFEKYEISVVFLTTRDTDGKSSMTYSDDFYDTNNFRPDGVLFMIDMDNREIYINTVGKCIYMISNTELYSCLDACYVHASNGEYNLCMTRMSRSICREIENELNPLLGAARFSFVTLVIMVIVTIIILSVLLLKHNRANQRTSAGHYIGSSFTVHNRNVVYMGCRPEVIPGYYDTSNRNGGGAGGGGHTGGSVHTSSRGVSHGGGGRRF